MLSDPHKLSRHPGQPHAIPEHWLSRSPAFPQQDSKDVPARCSVSEQKPVPTRVSADVQSPSAVPQHVKQPFFLFFSVIFLFSLWLPQILCHNTKLHHPGPPTEEGDKRSIPEALQYKKLLIYFICRVKIRGTGGRKTENLTQARACRGFCGNSSISCCLDAPQAQRRAVTVLCWSPNPVSLSSAPKLSVPTWPWTSPSSWVYRVHT